MSGPGEFPRVESFFHHLLIVRAVVDINCIAHLLPNEKINSTVTGDHNHEKLTLLLLVECTSVENASFQ